MPKLALFGFANFRLCATLFSGPGDGLGGYIAALTPDRDDYWGMGLGLV